MGQIVLGTVGAIAGSFIGQPALGFAIGSAIGGALFAPKLPTIRNTQQQLTDLRIVGAEYGQAIPHLFGSAIIAGQMWWNTIRRPITTTTTQRSGGKGGGGGQKTVTETTTYDMDCLIGLTNNEIVGITRIFDNGKLIFTSDSGATSGSIIASANAETWDRLTVYTGSDTQLPDPTYEAAIDLEFGAGSADAYRGRGYVFIQGLKLGQSGQVRNLTFEVVAAGTTSEGGYITPIVEGLEPNDCYVTFFSAFRPPGNPLSNEIWVRHGVGLPGTTPGTDDWDIALLDTVTGDLGTKYNGAEFESRMGVVGMAPSGDCYVGDVASTRLYKLYRDTRSELPTDYISLAADGMLAHFGVYDDGIGNLWVPASDNTFKKLFDVVFATHVFNIASTAVSLSFQRFLQNPGGIAGRIYFTFGSGNCGLRYIKTDDLTIVTVIAGAVLEGPQQLVGNDGNLYLHRTDFDGLVKADQDGVTISTCAYTSTGASFSGVNLQDSLGFVWADGAIPGFNGVFRINVTTMSIDMFVDLTETNARQVLLEISPAVIAIGADYAATGLTESVAKIEIFSRIAKVCPTVADVVSDLCLRAGLSVGQFDVTALSSITRDVCSLAISQITSTRTPLELLMTAYFFEMVLSGEKLKFVPRGSAAVASIPYMDLGATSGDDQPEPFALKQVNDLEIPAQRAVTYINIDDDYQTDTQYSDRLISATPGTVDIMQMAIGLHPSETKQVADTSLLDQAATQLSTTISLLGDYCRLEPTDNFLVTGKDGSIFRMRGVKKTDSYPVLTLDAVLDDTSVLSTQGITSTDFSPQTVVAAPAKTLMELMDIPILQDADDDSGFYVAAKGDSTPYPGSAIFDSPDDVTYTIRTTVRESAVFGTCTTTLGDWTGPRVFDEINTVRVNVGAGTLASGNRDALLANQSVNAMMVGSELLQFRTATLVSAGVYTLSGLLRGGRGTEWAMVDHVASERCVLLREAGIRRIVLQNSEIGIERFYKGVTLGRAVSTGTRELFTNNAVGLKPFSPQGVRTERDGSGNITFTVDRRSRFSVRAVGALGISVPLGETVEAYAINIFAVGSPDSLVRTLSVTGTNVLTYSSAQQIIDFGSNQSTVLIEACQLSATVGRGYPFEIAA